MQATNFKYKSRGEGGGGGDGAKALPGPWSLVPLKNTKAVLIIMWMWLLYACMYMCKDTIILLMYM